MKRFLIGCALLLPFVVLAASSFRNQSITVPQANLNAASGPVGTPLVFPLDPAGVQSCWMADGGPGGCVYGAFHLANVTGYRDTICATNGLLGAAGKLMAQFCPESNPSMCASNWPAMAAFNDTLTAATCALVDGGTAACQCQTFDHQLNGAVNGWLVLTPNGITTTDAGILGTLTIDGRNQP